MYRFSTRKPSHREDSQQDSCAHGEDTLLSFVNTYFFVIKTFVNIFLFEPFLK